MHLINVIYSHCNNFCGLQACVPLLVLLHCGFVFHMYWFTTVNVLNKQYLRKLTLKRTLLKIVVLGAFGAKDFEYRSW